MASVMAPCCLGTEVWPLLELSSQLEVTPPPPLQWPLQGWAPLGGNMGPPQSDLRLV